MSEVEAFVAIARTGTFTRAAEELHLSQPAISRRIELLERELGAALFERVHGGALLTTAGTAFLSYAQAILATARDGAAAVRAIEEEDRGVVTLALVGTLASSQLTARLRHFREIHPYVQLVLHTALSDEVGGMVQRGDANLGLRYFTDSHAGIISELVQEEALVVVCSMQRRLTEHIPVDARTLAGIPWVAFPSDAGSSTEPYARLLERQLYLWGLEDAPRIVIDSLTAQKRLIEADFGIGLLPISAIEEEVRLGTLRVLDRLSLETTVPVMVIHRRHGYLSGAARHLLADLTRGG